MRVRTICKWFVRSTTLLVAYPAAAANPDTVLGHVDGITETSGGAVVLTGWACWKGWSWSSPRVDVYAGAPAGQGGTLLGVYWTDQSTESAVSDTCQTSGIDHRFSITLNISMRQQFGGQKLYVYGYAYPGLGNNVLLDGSGQHRVPAAPPTRDTIYYIHADRLGSNVVMTDTEARVVVRTVYKAYGHSKQGTQKNETAGYTGHYEDPLTGLTYMQARYYDADLGRFMSVDPMGATPGNIANFGRYTYANNNPLMFIDPDGRNSVPKHLLYNGMGGPAVNLPGFSVSGGYRGGSMAGVSIGGGGGYRGDPANAVTEAPVVVTADVPPEEITVVPYPMMPAEMLWRNLLSKFKVTFNASFGFNASAQLLGTHFGGEVGLIRDTDNNLCGYYSATSGLGYGVPLWGSAGLVMSVGTGQLKSGSQVSYGSYWAGGAGVFGEGQILYTPGGGFSFARGIVGVSGSPEGVAGGMGGIKVSAEYRCF